MSFNNSGPGFVHSGGGSGVSGDGTGITDPEAFRDAIHGKDYLDVRDYGAVADWNAVIGASATGTNDLAAIQAALDAAYAGPIKTVMLAGPHFIEGGSLQIKGPDVVLRGHNRTTDIVYQHSTDQNAVTFAERLPDDPRINLMQGIHDFAIKGRGIGVSTGKGVDMSDRTGGYNGAKWLFERMDIRGFEIGVDVYFWDGWHISQSIILGNNTNLRLESFTNTVEIDHSSLGSAGTRSLHILSGASVVMEHMDFGNEPQAAKLETGSALYIQDSNLETFTGTSPTYKGAIELATGAKLVLDNVYITSAASALPAIYLAGADECYIGTGGLWTTFASNIDIQDASANSIITNANVPGYGTSGAAGAIKVQRVGLHEYKPGPFQTYQNNGVPQIPTAQVANRTDLQWSIANDLGGIHVNDRLFAMVRGKDQLYTAEPVLNRDLRIWDFISGTAGDLVKNGRYRDNNNATLIERFLPATAAAVQLDDTLTLMATGSGGIKVKVQAAQAHLIRYGALQTTANTGYITLSQGASCKLVCWSASGGGYWIVTEATGTITVV